MNQDRHYLSWNVRGLRGKLKKVQEEVKRIKALVTILCETRVKEWNMQKVMEHGWGYFLWFSNHNSHPGGQIFLLWDLEVANVNILISTAQLVHFELVIHNVPFLMSVVYGFNDIDGRATLWRDLYVVSCNMQCPWVVMGDFNAIRVLDERHRKLPSMSHDIDEFN